VTIVIDFLGIGAHKAATTWLMRNLASHTDVWVPFVKELHYFDIVHLRADRERLLARIKKRVRQITRRKRLSGTLSPGEQDYLRRVADPAFAFTDAWYAHIFSAAGPGKVRGEFTPLYCALPAEGIMHVKRLMPAVRLLYIIRDPVERMLSTLRVTITKHGNPDLRPVVESSSFWARGDYAGNITAWDAVFPASQMLYLPFGRVRTDPASVMRSVEKHLGLAPFDRYRVLDARVNPTQKSEIAEEVLGRVRELCEPQYEFLKRRFDQSFLNEIK
jgi:hypothetical protein